MPISIEQTAAENRLVKLSLVKFNPNERSLLLAHP